MSKIENPASFQNLIAHYTDLTQKLCQQKTVDPDLLLDCLLSRDKIAQKLSAQMETDPTSIRRLTDADQQLKSLMKPISQVKQMKDWHTTLSPPESAWWWHLKPPSPPKSLNFFERYDWVWRTLNIIVVTIIIALLVDIYPRFLSGGADTASAFALVANTVLAAITAGGVLTKAGGEALEHIFQTLKIPSYIWQEAKFGLGLLMLIFLMMFRALGLPMVAQYYYDKGQSFHANRQLLPAQSAYERALKVNSNDTDRIETQIHHQLGILHEQLQDLDQARTEYRIAVQSNYAPPYNDLARLEILAGNYETAVFLLLRGKNLITNDETLVESEEGRELLYNFRKNLGWVRLEQERYQEAKAELEQAIALDSRQASAHCLLAQVLEQQENFSESLQEWETCRQIAEPLSNPDADQWIYQAQQRARSPMTMPLTRTLEITATSQPALSEIDPGYHLLISATGPILLKRANWTNYYTTTVGVKLYRGDQIQPLEGVKVSILCSDLTIWPLPEDVTSGLNGCPLLPDPILIRNTDILSTPLTASSSTKPYIISPRATYLLTDTVTLRWNPVSEALTYTLRLTGTDLNWQTTTQKTSLPYDGEIPLERGEAYYFMVQTDNGEQSQNTDELAFTLLDEETTEKIQKQIASLQLTDIPNQFALTHLYSLNSLTAEAIILLESLIKEENQPAIVYLTLGDLYDRVGLIIPAQEYYESALEIAQAANDLEQVAESQIKLAKLLLPTEAEQAAELFDQARKIYEQLGDRGKIEQIDARQSSRGR